MRGMRWQQGVDGAVTGGGIGGVGNNPTEDEDEDDDDEIDSQVLLLDPMCNASAFGGGKHCVTQRRAAARQRQVDIGKARPEYVRYLQCVPKEHRTQSRPRTPDPKARVSKRQFDRQLSEWRRKLHEYDDGTDPQALDESPSLIAHITSPATQAAFGSATGSSAPPVPTASASGPAASGGIHANPLSGALLPSVGPAPGGGLLAQRPLGGGIAASAGLQGHLFQSGSNSLTPPRLLETTPPGLEAALPRTITAGSFVNGSGEGLGVMLSVGTCAGESSSSSASGSATASLACSPGEGLRPAPHPRYADLRTEFGLPPPAPGVQQAANGVVGLQSLDPQGFNNWTAGSESAWRHYPMKVIAYPPVDRSTPPNCNSHMALDFGQDSANSKLAGDTIEHTEGCPVT